MRKYFLPLLAGCLLLSAGPLAAQSYSSGPRQVHLMELYTSEGCSSCPPADYWLRQWSHRSELWERLIPLAFHVDYWDYLGWQDPFAAPEHSVRQRRYQRERALSAVYTPGFVFDGSEWRRWSGGHLPDLDAGRQVGDLELRIRAQEVAVRFVPVGDVGRPRIYLAVLGFDLKTEVPAGENRGRLLRHDFVVLGMSDTLMSPSEGGFNAHLALPSRQRPAPRTAVAAWVTNGLTQAPLQAVGGWLEN